MGMVTEKIPDILQAVYSMEDGEKINHCISCGVCSSSCPYAQYMDRSIRWMIAAARDRKFEDLMKCRAIWMCIGCVTCAARCPRGINKPDTLIASVREAILCTAKEIPAELQDALESAVRYGNPLGESPNKRDKWVAGAGVPVKVMKKCKEADILWFVGSYPSYYPANVEITKKLAWIFQGLELDFAILGVEEQDTGDSFRLAGEAGLFELLMEKNMKAFKKYKFNKIVVTDPHDYNALVRKYPGVSKKYEILHYTQLLNKHLTALKAGFKNKLDYTVTYHDPCYLGRKNDIYDEPRDLLKAIPGLTLVEMPWNRKTSLCCAGGGGAMWLDGFIQENSPIRASDIRVKMAVDTGASILAVACPYEISRFNDSIKVNNFDGKLRVKDIGELIYEAMI